MDIKYLRALPLGILFLLCLAMAFGLLGGKPSDHDTRMVGRHFSAFDLPSVGSSAHFSPKLWEGKVAVVNVFASWCGPCGVEHPVLMKLAQKNVPIYGIAWKDTSPKVAAWLLQRGNPYQQVGLDEHGVTTISLALTGVPETFIINKDGTVYYHYKTGITDKAADTLILPLIERLNQVNAQ